ncbi:unnamed protein product, partial [Meganyctiphanes norvegica]
PQVCVLLSFMRLLSSEKVLPQKLHYYGFSPVCAIISCIRLLSFEHFHVTIAAALIWFSPVCVLLWHIRLSPVCVLRCHLRLLIFEKVLSQWLHCYCFSPVCIFI